MRKIGVSEKWKADKESALQVSILDYLKEKGIPYEKEGPYYRCSSPFSKDKIWSFTIYPDSNSFFDFSSRLGGDVIALAMALEEKSFTEAVRSLNNNAYEKYEPPKYPTKKKEFNLESFVNYNEEEIKAIRQYANSRGITNGYKYGIFFTKVDNIWKRHPSVLFPHYDEDMKVTGCKLRVIDKNDPNRFSARGRLGFYVLENIIRASFSDPIVYLVEGETSANSLWEYFRKVKHSAVVISCGAVSSVPKVIPKKYRDYKLKVIIDYDGDESLYAQRCDLYKELGGEHIRLILPKGDDLNSLWAKGKMNLITNLIF